MSTEPCVFIVDDDYAVRDALRLVIENAGLTCQTFESAEHFLQASFLNEYGCLLLDVNMPGMSGDELQAELNRRNMHFPIIFLTAYGSIPQTVRVMKAGAIDYLTKPISNNLLIKRIQAVLQEAIKRKEKVLAIQMLNSRLNELTSRELEILPLIAAGHSNKEIGRQLGISYRTIEVHRARILRKTGMTSILELGRLCEACQLVSDQAPQEMNVKSNFPES
ncbi:two component transcriptional regulator, LuxR family [Nitrosomonas sp. Is79A3]|uniref:response regulator n=1 Tax=Nitrosomonas sp. (strain Is79A3) TaxID=261292 RepID=UPI000215CC3E